MPRQNKKTPEGYVKSAVMELLTLRRVFYIRTNSGLQVITNPDTGKRRALQMAPAGTADILALPTRRYMNFDIFQPLWIETKAMGKKQSPNQKHFEMERIADGHAYIVAYSIEDVDEWLDNFYRFNL